MNSGLWPGPLPVYKEQESFQLSHGDAAADPGKPSSFFHLCKNTCWATCVSRSGSCLCLSDENLILVGRAAELSSGATRKT